MKLKDVWVFILKFHLENPRLNKKPFLKDFNSLPTVLKTKV